MEALEVFSSGNITNVLITSLSKLLEQGPNLNVDRTSIPNIMSISNVIMVLSDAATTVAEGTGDPSLRDYLFNYSKDMQQQAVILNTIIENLETEIFEPDPMNVSKMLTVAKTVKDKTANLVTAGEDAAQKQTIESARNCATSAKNLINALCQYGFEDFLEASRTYAQSAIDFVSTLKRVARAYENNKAHQQKIIQACAAIKEMGPNLIRSSKLAFENPGSEQLLMTCVEVTKELAGKISYAVSVARADGANLEPEQPAQNAEVPIPIPTQAAQEPGRKKTIANPNQGREVLQRVRTATLKMEMEDIVTEDLDSKKDTYLKKERTLTEEPPVVVQQQPVVQQAPVVQQQTAPIVQTQEVVTDQDIDDLFNFAEDEVNSIQEETAVVQNTVEPVVQQTPVVQPEPEQKPQEQSVVQQQPIVQQAPVVQQAPASDGGEWEKKYNDLLVQQTKLKKVNTILQEENEQLHTVVDSLRKRIAAME